VRPDGHGAVTRLVLDAFRSPVQASGLVELSDAFSRLPVRTEEVGPREYVVIGQPSWIT
jgi:hypothetical protein